MFGLKKPKTLSTEAYTAIQIADLTRRVAVLEDMVTALEMKVGFLSEPAKAVACCKAKKKHKR